MKTISTNLFIRLHRISALFIAGFALLHIANHLVSVFSIQAHLAVMEWLRQLYRWGPLEAILLASVLLQIGSGLWLVLRGWMQRCGVVAWLQAGSGLYLALFLLIHVSAVLYGREILHLDTNFYYAAAGLHVPPNGFFFAPYYFLAVLALCVHVACAFQRRSQRASPGNFSILGYGAGVGLIVSGLIVLSLAGKFQPVLVPAKYLATFNTSTPVVNQINNLQKGER